ncbi:hypothetical protein DFH09DRAFT_1097668 [Mycena vulgaris]|nr:hypothetical protein DFH09DRAFT_1097668 [Mycena vulgaris]
MREYRSSEELGMPSIDAVCVILDADFDGRMSGPRDAEAKICANTWGSMGLERRERCSMSVACVLGGILRCIDANMYRKGHPEESEVTPKNGLGRERRGHCSTGAARVLGGILSCNGVDMFPKGHAERWEVTPKKLGRERRERCSTGAARVLGEIFSCNGSYMYPKGHAERWEVTPKKCHAERWEVTPKKLGRERRERCSTGAARVLGEIFGCNGSYMYPKGHAERWEFTPKNCNGSDMYPESHAESWEVTPKNRPRGGEATSVGSQKENWTAHQRVGYLPEKSKNIWRAAGSRTSACDAQEIRRVHSAITVAPKFARIFGDCRPGCKFPGPRFQGNRSWNGWGGMGRERRGHCSTGAARVLGGIFGCKGSDTYPKDHAERWEVAPKKRPRSGEAATVGSQKGNSRAHSAMTAAPKIARMFGECPGLLRSARKSRRKIRGHFSKVLSQRRTRTQRAAYLNDGIKKKKIPDAEVTPKRLEATPKNSRSRPIPGVEWASRKGNRAFAQHFVSMFAWEVESVVDLQEVPVPDLRIILFGTRLPAETQPGLEPQ